MNELENKIEQMLPSELIKIKCLIDKLLEFKENNNRTNLDYLKKVKTIYCDININHNVKKNGKKDGIQRYYCTNCEKKYSVNEAAEKVYKDYCK